jgi:hypothetical protein
VDPRDVEQRLRRALQSNGEPETPPQDAWTRVERRLGRQPWRRAGIAGLALALVAALAFVVVPRITQRDGRPAGPGTVTTTPTPDPTTDPMEQAFPAFHPVTTFEEAKKLQDSVDNGHQPLLLDPAEVARQFARDYIGWQKVELGAVTKDGSAAAGWTAKVELRPYIGEVNPPTHLGTRHVVDLVGLRGAEEPTWFVTAIGSDNIVLDLVREDAGSVQIKGKGVGFEGTINTRIKDDAGTVLHPRPGKGNEGFVQGGAMEPAPFEGTLAYDTPKTPDGVLILTGGSGLEGPSPDWTIVRIGF